MNGLIYFDVQLSPKFSNESPLKWAPVCFWHAPSVFGTLPYFLTKDGLSLLQPWNSTISPRAFISFQRGMLFRTQVVSAVFLGHNRSRFVEGGDSEGPEAWVTVKVGKSGRAIKWKVLRIQGTSYFGCFDTKREWGSIPRYRSSIYHLSFSWENILMYTLIMFNLKEMQILKELIGSEEIYRRMIFMWTT